VHTPPAIVCVGRSVTTWVPLSQDMGVISARILKRLLKSVWYAISVGRLLAASTTNVFAMRKAIRFLLAVSSLKIRASKALNQTISVPISRRKNHIPPDLVVKCQAIDNAEVIFSRIWAWSIVQTSSGTGKGGVSRFHHRRPIGLPLNPVESANFHVF
jgi:hypothetical protein